MSSENQELPGMMALAKGVQEGTWPHTMDAQVWARKWLEITKDKPGVATDEGAMISWFANAIMAGYDSAMLRSNATGVEMELVLIRGLPGSGKTTMARVLAMVGYEHHEADHYFERDGVYRFDHSELPKAHSWCLERAKNSISRGVRCVVANTFTQRWEMQPYLDAAKAAGVTVRVIEARGEWENCHGVPADAIERMRRRWESVDA